MCTEDKMNLNSNILQAINICKFTNDINVVICVVLVQKLTEH